MAITVIILVLVAGAIGYDLGKHGQRHKCKHSRPKATMEIVIGPVIRK